MQTIWEPTTCTIYMYLDHVIILICERRDPKMEEHIGVS